MEYVKERNKDASFVSVNTLIQPSKYDRSNETGKEVHKNDESGLLDRIISGGLTGAARVIEKVPSVNFVPIPGFGFMQNFIKGMMVGSIERLSNEQVEHLWKIVKNVARAVTSFDYMKAYFWGFLKGFFGDFIMLWELPGTIKSTVIFIQHLIAKIKELSREDLREFAGRIDEIKSYLIEESSAFINNILQDIKAGKASELIIETLKSLTNFSLDAGKSVGGQLTGVMLNFFSKDHQELGKDLGGFMGELSGTVAFTALLAAITAGIGSVWSGVRSGIKTLAGIIRKGVGQGVKAIGTIFKDIGRIFGTFIDVVRAVIKGFGRGASKLFKGIKGKIDEILVKVKGLIDDVVKWIDRKYLEASGKNKRLNKLAEVFSYYTDLATKNADSSEVILGKFSRDGLSYNIVARDRGATYFELDNWDEIVKEISVENMWKINEEFLERQWKAGKNFYLSHDPDKATGSFLKEIRHLKKLGAREFIKTGDGLWKVIK